ncbi:MAG: Valyl-tRNA synthetase [uncultured Thermomicrobiales bacterium]|uniref:Valine--tRNA ligase n=1 Tax=uncultured Thermomicrobiales bacterium TaxID=1645740 RepID=A0A6J4V1Z9_9BACT|nr:MAG: Valyl-tRNA synthetase [uncultured Thermomicrobiales bacterium]
MATASTSRPAIAQQDELASSYDPAAIEQGLYDWWDSQGFFAPPPERDGDSSRPFVTIMPPPNVTDVLHVGHALFVALQDIMTRWHRMRGEPSLWLPGADHAGIAGQWVVERLLAEEGLTRHDLGREKFLERVWEFMNEYRPRIREQMKLLGASCDWSRFSFTMDPGPARAVRVAFKHLYDKGLIYRGERIISWCPRCRTALSDLEVKHREEPTSLWHLAYPVEGLDEVIEVATTRPETMLGDTGVAVHPDDERYRHLTGKRIRLPIVNRLIPIVADRHVDREFGTGAVKVTPAHDPNDFEIAQRTGLPGINILNLDATLNENAGEFQGMTIDQARRDVVARAQAEGWLVSIEPHTHSVGHCDRCDTVIQPLISKQWFVKMAPLAEPALAAAQYGQLTFIPERYKGVYDNWLENIHDWTISRQLWWGHQIPIWYCQRCEGIHVTVEETLAACPDCGGPVEQDPDVLDTWFSSSLWPMSTLGWPDRTPDLARFYPGTVMETGYEIIFHWVARMVFMGIELMGEVPFETVYLHGMVRDIDGAKMSKTKGNGIDPIEVSSLYGADALRLTLVTQASPGNDSRLSIQKVEAGRNFGNKLWNATRFALRSIGDSAIAMEDDGPARPTGDLALADRWILSRLDEVTRSSTRLLETYQFGEAGRQINDFIWTELCDWYIEAAKVRLREESSGRGDVAQVLAYTMERSLRLLHPFMPFITEALWQRLPHVGTSIMIASWPEAGEKDADAEHAFGTIMGLVRGIRNARAEAGVEPARWIAAHVYAGDLASAIESSRAELGLLARVADDQLVISGDEPRHEPRSMTVLAGEAVAILPLAEMIDVGVERARLERELEEAEQERQRAEKQLGNESFVSRAPEHVVKVQRDRLARSTEQIAIIRNRLEALDG